MPELIADLPLDDRPREKLRRHGSETLSDAELLAILLGSGTRGKNAIQLARELLAGGLGALGRSPIEAIASNETIAVPEDLVGRRDTYVLRVRGDSMIDEQIRDGDFVVVEDRKTADNGEMVIALLRGSDVTLKKFYRDPGGKIRLQPANAAMQPIFADPDQVQIQGVVVGVMRKY